jgi:hypothetical protein
LDNEALYIALASNQAGYLGFRENGVLLEPRSDLFLHPNQVEVCLAAEGADAAGASTADASTAGAASSSAARGGTGTARPLQFVINGVNMLELQAGGGIVANRGIITTGGYGITSDLHFTLQAATGQLRWGGTSSVPMLKRSSATLQVRLGDDSAFASLACGALTLNGNLDASTRDIVTDTTTGTKIGTGTTQKIGFFNATPVVQQAAVADATDAASTQARLNDLLARLRTLGLIAT